MYRFALSLLLMGLPLLASGADPTPQPSTPPAAPQGQPSPTSNSTGSDKKEQKATTTPTFPSSGETFGPGDAVIPLQCIPEFTTQKPEKNGAEQDKYSVPERNHARLKGKDEPAGTAVFWIDTKADSDGIIQGHFVKHGYRRWYVLTGTEDEGELAGCDGKDGVTLNKKYYVSSGSLDTYATSRLGITYGALTVPYKWHGSDHSIDAAPTVAAFVGYYVGRPGADVALVFSAGLGGVPVPTVKNGQAQNDLKTSLSLAIGPVITLSRGQRFQLGLLFGTDWLSDAAKSDYKYNGKLWGAISLGVDLTK